MSSNDDGTLRDQYEDLRKRYDALDVEMESYLGPDGKFRRMLEQGDVTAHPSFISDSSERHYRARIRLNPDALNKLVEEFRDIRKANADAYRTLRAFERRHPDIAQ
jgi:hypothetical protein